MTEDEIDGADALALRKRQGISQPKFWNPVGVSQAMGSKFEAGRHQIPASVRKLLFVRYVAGLDLDNPKQADFRNLKRLLKAQRDNNKGDK